MHWGDPSQVGSLPLLSHPAAASGVQRATGHKGGPDTHLRADHEASDLQIHPGVATLFQMKMAEAGEEASMGPSPLFL